MLNHNENDPYVEFQHEIMLNKRDFLYIKANYPSED
jgi:hypothetical protein